MAFADHLTATKRTGGTTNLIDQALATMTEQEADAARVLLAMPLSDEHLAEVFTKEGHPVKWGSVRNWRKANGIVRPKRGASA